MNGYERAVAYAERRGSWALLTALREEGHEGDGCDYNKMVDEWEKEEFTQSTQQVSLDVKKEKNQ